MPPARVAAIDHRKFNNGVAHRQFPTFTGLHVESPAVRHRFVGIDTQSTESFALTSFWRIGSFQPGWIVLKEAVQNNFIAILIGIGPVQDECWVGFEPLDILRRSVARNDSEATGKVRSIGIGIIPFGQGFRVPEKWQVVKNGIVFRERHIVWQSRTR